MCRRTTTSARRVRPTSAREWRPRHDARKRAKRAFRARRGDALEPRTSSTHTLARAPFHLRTTSQRRGNGSTVSRVPRTKRPADKAPEGSRGFLGGLSLAWGARLEPRSGLLTPAVRTTKIAAMLLKTFCSLSLSIVVINVAGCSNSNSNNDGSSGSQKPSSPSGGEKSCDSICEHVGQVCKQAPVASCASSCASWSSSQKNCLSSMTACTEIAACETSAPPPDGRTDPEPLTCAPFAYSTDTAARCKSGCVFSFTPTAPAGKDTFNWCSKSCTNDTDCGSNSRCAAISGTSNEEGCIPTCSTDADCTTHGGWGACRHVRLGTGTDTSYCTNGPNGF